MAVLVGSKGNQQLRGVDYSRNSSAKQKSLRDQRRDHRAAAADMDVDLVLSLSDSTSASRYARKARENWQTILGMLAEIDIVLLWEASRGDRTLASWIGLLDACRANGVLIHATGHSTTYDPRKPRDYRSLAEDGVDAAYESDKTSMRLRRGFASAAASGKPHSRIAYGYERVYHPRTGSFVEQRPHPVQAEIVREIVRRIGKGDPLQAIAKDLTRRHIPAPGGPARHPLEMIRRSRRGEPIGEIAANLVKRGIVIPGTRRGTSGVDVVEEVLRRSVGEDDEPERIYLIAEDLVERGLLNPCAVWHTLSLTQIARNPVYRGVRVHRSKTGERHEYAGQWPAIVTDAEHHAALRVLGAPDRVPYRGPRPGRATSLVGNIAFCGTCGRKMAAKTPQQYRCCVNIGRPELDELVTDVILGRLADAKVFGKLRHASEGDDRAVVQARADIDRLTAELAGWRQSAVDGQTSPDSLATIEAGITKKLNAAQRRVERANIPPVVRELVEPGADVRQRWRDAPLGAKRDVIRTLTTITVHSFHGRGRKITNRVQIDWRGERPTTRRRAA